MKGLLAVSLLTVSMLGFLLSDQTFVVYFLFFIFWDNIMKHTHIHIDELKELIVSIRERISREHEIFLVNGQHNQQRTPKKNQLNLVVDV